MELMLLRTFQHQIEIQCGFALRAAAEVESGLSKYDIGATFCGIQSLLNAAANIRKALWGSTQATQSARKALRDSLEVADDSSLRSVSMRNHNEHFDERIDRWWETSKSHNFADFNIGPISAVQGVEDIDRFRWFDPTTGDILFWGERFNLRTLVEEVKRLHLLATREASKPHWEK